MNNNTQKTTSLYNNKILFFLAYFFMVQCFAGTSANSTLTTDNSDLVSNNSVAINNNDPYEKFNRVIFSFNDHLDKAILKPIATFYNLIIPKPLNRGIHNFFNNLGNLPTIANDVLQANFHQAANDFWRLGINSTIGVAGLFDVAAKIKLPPYSNDFGLTLAKWGYKNSNYLVLPFLGPSSIRDGISLPVDYYAFSIYPHLHPDKTRYGVYSLEVVDKRARLLQFQPILEEAAVDRYVFVRDAYRQHRAYQISEKKQTDNNN